MLDVLTLKSMGSWALSRWKMCTALLGRRVLDLRKGGFGACWPTVVLKATRVDEFTKGEYVGAKRRGSSIEPYINNLKNH